jgi:hypothetical protein
MGELMRRIWVLAVTLGCTLITQAKADALVAQIAATRSEIMVAAPTVRSATLAVALHQALVTRGVAVYLLVEADLVEDPAAYVLSLYLAGASVRLAEQDALDGAYLILDRTLVLSGDFWDLDPTESNGSTTSDAAKVGAFVAWFYEAYHAMRNYVPDLKELGGDR